MKRIAIVLVAVSSLVGCAGMGTKRSPGAQIQRTTMDAPTIDTGSPLDGRPELGQR